MVGLSPCLVEGVPPTKLKPVGINLRLLHGPRSGCPATSRQQLDCSHIPQYHELDAAKSPLRHFEVSTRQQSSAAYVALCSASPAKPCAAMIIDPSLLFGGASAQRFPSNSFAGNASPLFSQVYGGFELPRSRGWESAARTTRTSFKCNALGRYRPWTKDGV